MSTNVPILPNWCDFNEWTLRQKLSFIGITRAILCLTSFGLCLATILEAPSLGLSIVLSLIIITNIVHFCFCIFFVIKSRSGNSQIIKGWFYTDNFLSIILILLIFILLFTIPPRPVSITVAFALMMLSVLLCFRFSMYYLRSAEQGVILL